MNALNACELEQYDIAMINFHQNREDGIELAQKIMLYRPTINIIFYSDEPPLLNHISHLFISDFIQLPITVDKIMVSFSHLRYHIKDPPGLQIQTFGYFEIFYKGMPLKFKYTKSKEVLAYLIDRQGAMCTSNDLMAVLWEDDDFNSHREYFKKIRQDIMTVLTSIGCENLIILQRGAIGIKANEIDCDLYRYLSRYHNPLYVYRGEYMAQYSWAELTHATIQ